MDLGKKSGRMEQNILETMLMGKKKEREIFYGQTGLNMKAISIRIAFMVMAHIPGLMEGNTLATEKMIKCTGKESLFGLMEGGIMENIWKIKNMDMESFNGLMEGSMMENG